MNNEKNIAIVKLIYADVMAKNLEGFLASRLMISNGSRHLYSKFLIPDCEQVRARLKIGL